MFERFSGRARHVVVLAQEEARLMSHNYIGTEHLLLGLVHEEDGVGGRILASVGMTLEGTRQDVAKIIGPGKHAPSGHIPFTPRAKKVLELSLREALQLRHKYIGTEHILLGLVREADGVAAQIMRQHADLLAIRAAVLSAVLTGPADPERGRSWRRRIARIAEFIDEPGERAEPGEPPVRSELSATPAADTTLSEAARLAGTEPVGSHHLLIAALADANSAAAKALAALGVNLDQAKDALRAVEIAGTSDEQPEDAGRRQMVIHVTDDKLTVEVTDPVLIQAGRRALAALAPEAGEAGAIHGADPPVHGAASLAAVWLAIRDALSTIARQAPRPDAEPVTSTGSPQTPDKPEKPGEAGKSGKSGPEAA